MTETLEERAHSLTWMLRMDGASLHVARGDKGGGPLGDSYDSCRRNDRACIWDMLLQKLRMHLRAGLLTYVISGMHARRLGHLGFLTHAMLPVHASIPVHMHACSVPHRGFPCNVAHASTCIHPCMSSRVLWSAHGQA